MVSQRVVPDSSATYHPPQAPLEESPYRLPDSYQPSRGLQERVTAASLARRLTGQGPPPRRPEAPPLMTRQYAEEWSQQERDFASAGLTAEAQRKQRKLSEKERKQREREREQRDRQDLAAQGVRERASTLYDLPSSDGADLSVGLTSSAGGYTNTRAGNDVSRTEGWIAQQQQRQDDIQRQARKQRAANARWKEHLRGRRHLQ